MKFEDKLRESFFLHRLSSLQALCSTTNDELPDALVFIAGLDGKQNKGSMMVMKYLFQASTGRDIYEASLEEHLDCLEECVLVIQESSVSVFWNQASKKAVGPTLNAFPFVTEYCSTKEEEENVDLFEQRKCEDFKRMILEHVPEGGVIGLAVPLGYDDVMDCENWPLLQSFALDSVFCATGFFTARYAVIDMTDSLDILFRTVDGYYLEKAIKTIQSSVVKHTNEILDPLRRGHDSEHRRKIKASDLISPLQILFDFGCLDAAFPVDPALEPVIYLGPEHASHCLGKPITNKKWLDVSVGSSVSAITEGFEPSTGMRWCRTYFLRRGKCLDTITDPDSLVSDENVEAESTFQKERNDMRKVLTRMEELYFKLCVSFRYAVRRAFCQHNDVLDAGKFVQEIMHRLTTGQEKLQSASEVDSIKLLPSESLQVHMDCMNAHGQIVGIEDVDDMGGQCWTYIRVSIHGIAGVPESNESYAIAIGDTFLFSPCYHLLGQEQRTEGRVCPNFKKIVHLQDSICLTHAVPLSSRVLGSDREEVVARDFFSHAISLHMQSALGLGKAMSTSGSGVVTVPMLTDHPDAPVLLAEMRLFSSGFVVGKMNDIFCPFMVSMGVHVKEMATIDFGDCFQQVSKKYPGGLWKSTIDSFPDGLMIIFKCHDFEATSSGCTQSSKSVKSCVEYNMLDRILPDTGKARHIALCLSSTSHHGSSLTESLHEWRRSARTNDIPESRGVGSMSVPDQILLSFLTWVDEESIKMTTGSEVAINEELSQFVPGTIQLPGTGFFSMRANFMLSENLKMKGLASECIQSDAEVKGNDLTMRQSRLSSTGQVSDDSILKKRIIMTIGVAGSGVLALSLQLVNRLTEETKTNSLKISSGLIVVDLTQGDPEEVIRRSIEKANRANADCVVMTVVTSATNRVPLSSLFYNVEGSGFVTSYVISVISSQSIENYLQGHCRLDGCGYETWAATAKEPLCYSDVVVFVQPTKSSASPCLNEHFQSMNLDAISVRVHPGQLWVDTDVVEQAVASLTHTSPLAQQRTRFANVVTKSPSPPKKNLKLRVLCSLHFEVPQGFSRWDIESVEELLRQVLFPSALVSNTCPQEQWTVPPNSEGLFGMARCIQLAKCKTFAVRQHEKGRDQFADFLTSILADEASVKSLRSGTLGVQGTLSCKSLSGDAVCLEATLGAIILRKWTESGAKGLPLDVITVEGVFDEKEAHYLGDIIEHCVPFSLPDKSMKSAGDLSPHELVQVQQKYSEEPIPEGWWFDGTSYVDIYGKRSTLRPDIDQLSDKFTREQNKDVKKYNQLLHDVKKFL